MSERLSSYYRSGVGKPGQLPGIERTEELNAGLERAVVVAGAVNRACEQPFAAAGQVEANHFGLAQGFGENKPRSPRRDIVEQGPLGMRAAPVEYSADNGSLRPQPGRRTPIGHA